MSAPGLFLPGLPATPVGVAAGVAAVGPVPDVPLLEPALAASGPWAGFAVAADAAVRDLHARYGLDLWMATHVDGERQVVVAAAGPWREHAPPGSSLSWADSFCWRMLALGGPGVAPDVRTSPAYAPAARGPAAGLRAYVGVPLLTAEGQLLGTLCAYGSTAQPPEFAGVLGQVQLLGRMLSTIQAGEQLAADRSQDAAQAYALAERDRLTGLRNRRGWESDLLAEEQRARRYGSAVSVLALDLDDLKRINDQGGHAAGDEALMACGAVLTGTCRPGDALSRMGGDEFGVLAIECDAVAVRALGGRLRVGLRVAGVAASVGWATRRPDEALLNTWHRADEAMYRDKRRRRRVTSAVPEQRRS